MVDMPVGIQRQGQTIQEADETGEHAKLDVRVNKAQKTVKDESMKKNLKKDGDKIQNKKQEAMEQEKAIQQVERKKHEERRRK